METMHTHIQREFTHADMKKNIPFAFQVPAGTTSLKIRLVYAPLMVEGIANLLTLTVFDPGGFRGAAHRHEDQLEVVLQQDFASPGFFPGAIQPGEWTVFIDTHNIMPGAPLRAALEVIGSDPSLTVGKPVWRPGATAPRGPGWYRGDLHAHTLHSDASWDVPGLVAFARAHRLDFVTLTDHNTVSALAQLDSFRSDDLLTIGGMELTTFWGHALSLGLRDWVDWRVSPEKRDMRQIEREITAQGGLFILAHPRAIGDPTCTGCRWMFEEMMPGVARVVEVWNSDWNSESFNEDGLKLAYEWMNQGLRLALTSGTDQHGSPFSLTAPVFDVVFARELSETAILDAVRAGRLYMSVGPILALEAKIGSQRAALGEVAAARAGQPFQVSSRWGECPPGSLLELIVDGASFSRIDPSGAPSATWELRGGEAAWALITLRAGDGEMLALTNPIYFDGRS